MLRKLLFLLLLFPCELYAACTGSSPNWTCASQSFADIQSCVSGATAGDTITVTGNANWVGNTLSVTRGVNLIGSGNPTITCDVPAIYWNASAAAQTAHDTLKISGFTFDANNTSGSGVGIIRASAGWNGSYVDLVILNNTFKNTQDRAIYINGIIFGVAASNTLDRIGIPITVGALDGLGWANLTQDYGQNTNFFFEDNTMQYSSSTTPYAGFIEASNGAKWVVRYNTWDQTNAAMDSMWDNHGLQVMSGLPTDKTCESFSIISSEFYGNKILNMTVSKKWMGTRGGQLMMFNNTYGTTGDTNITTDEYSCDTCQSPSPPAYTQHITNTYGWSNLKNNTTSIPIATGLDYCSDAGGYTITENRDFYTYNAAFDGTTGVGAGTLVARPATCTSGVGYWATSQSTSDLTGMVGASPTTPISGSFYKCVDNAWSETPYYAPYTYPHPLRGDITAPTISSFTVDPSGAFVTMTGNENLVPTISTGLTLTSDGGAVTLTYASGSGTTDLVYSTSRTILSTETITYDYTQPGNGIEDASGNDLASITGGAVTNSSTQSGAVTGQTTHGVTGSTVYAGSGSTIYQ